jgi:hypothetical protein
VHDDAKIKKTSCHEKHKEFFENGSEFPPVILIIKIKIPSSRVVWETFRIFDWIFDRHLNIRKRKV